ncbi:MAG: SecY family transport protein [Hyphomonadaceae bacterium]
MSRSPNRGIGNGSSLIIFSGIAAGLPQRCHPLVHAWSSNGEMNVLVALGLICSSWSRSLRIIVFLEVGQRRIPIQYSQRAPSRRMAWRTPQQSHLPMKINFSNVIPPIFASSLLMFPATMSQFVQIRRCKQLDGFFTTRVSVIYNLLFVGLIVFFSFFYTEIVFNPTEVSDNLKKYGGFIPGIRAGKSTADYIKTRSRPFDGCRSDLFECDLYSSDLLIQQLNFRFTSVEQAY